MVEPIENEVGVFQDLQCPSCGWEYAWDVDTQTASCVYCKTSKKIDLETIPAASRPFLQLLRNFPRQRGFGVPMEECQCEHCGADFVFMLGQAAHTCCFCDRSHVVVPHTEGALLRPEAIIPFKVNAKQAKGAALNCLKRYYQTKGREDNGQVVSMQVIYAPFWCFSAEVSTNLFTYSTDRHGRVHEFHSGHRREIHSGVMVYAGTEAREAGFNGITPFFEQWQVPFSPELLAGLAVLEPKMKAMVAYSKARRRIQTMTGTLPEERAGYSLIQNSEMKLVFAPVWVVRVDGALGRNQVMVNGYNAHETAMGSGQLSHPSHNILDVTRPVKRTFGFEMPAWAGQAAIVAAIIILIGNLAILYFYNEQNIGDTAELMGQFSMGVAYFVFFMGYLYQKLKNWTL